MGAKRKADPKESLGAREERAAFREMLRRRIKRCHDNDARRAFEDALAWVMGRQARYDAAPGGLGKR